jgi:alpha-galactosidase
MKRFRGIGGIALLCVAAAVLAAFASGCGRKAPVRIDLADGWRFSTGDSLHWASPGFDDSGWKPIRPDRLWEEQGWNGYDGFGWYRVRFFLPGSLRASAFFRDSVEIVLGRIDDTDQAFLNGALIGQNAMPMVAGPAGPFAGNRESYAWVRRYALSADDARLLWDQANTLAVRVHDHGGGGGLYSGIPAVRVRALSDFVLIDDGQSPFEQTEQGGFRKTIFLRNLSADRRFAGTIEIRVEQSEPRRVLFHGRKQAVLDPLAGFSQSFSFDAPSGAAASVTVSFRDDASGQSVFRWSEVPYILTPPPPDEPRINGARIYGQRPGRPFLYRIPATGVRPMTFDADGLPEGLKVDRASGIIRGRISAEGTHVVRLRARNALGEASRPLKIVIGDRIQLTPPMGWNSWNCWGLAVDDQKVRAAADQFILAGLADHGWTYVNIDDGWEREARLPDGGIATNRKFPDMKKTADYVHDQGLKIGIYSSPGPRTCGGYLGSWGHEEQDARTWAAWGIDYLKYDWCSYGTLAKDAGREELMKPYRVMRRALDRLDRDIIFSLCQYGMGNVWEWGDEVGGNLWRTTGDITDTWKSMSEIGFSQTVQGPFAGAGRWNDPDMLVVGWVGWGPALRRTGLTASEQYTHISLWCLLSAPLLLGCDLSRLDAFTLNLLTNDEVLAVNQDPLGRQAGRVSDSDSIQVWAKPLEDGSTAVGLFNLGLRDRKGSVSWEQLSIQGTQRVRDLWRQKDLGSHKNGFKTGIPGHGVVLIRIEGA